MYAIVRWTLVELIPRKLFNSASSKSKVLNCQDLHPCLRLDSECSGNGQLSRGASSANGHKPYAGFIRISHKVGELVTTCS